MTRQGKSLKPDHRGTAGVWSEIGAEIGVCCFTRVCHHALIPTSMLVFIYIYFIGASGVDDDTFHALLNRMQKIT